jgi:hypothetical protein
VQIDDLPVLDQGNRRAWNTRGGDYRLDRLVGPCGGGSIEHVCRLRDKEKGREETGQKRTSGGDTSSTHGGQGIKTEPGAHETGWLGVLSPIARPRKGNRLLQNDASAAGWLSASGKPY